MKYWEIRFVNPSGSVVGIERYDECDDAKARERETRYAEPAGSGWTITAYGDSEAESPGLRDD